MELTSINNKIVKETAKLLQKKYRDKENLFLLEGFKAIEEAFISGIELKEVFVLKEKADKYAFLKKDLIRTTEAVLKKISAADSAPEAVTVGVQKHFSIKQQASDLSGALLQDVL